MLRSDACFTLFAAFTIVGVTGEYILYNNGWTPVSPDKIYNQIRKEHLYTSNNDLDLINGTYYGLVQHQSQKESKKDMVTEEIQLDNQHNLGPVTFQQKTNEEDQNIAKRKESVRQGKNIAEYIINKKMSVASNNNKDKLITNYNTYGEMTTIKPTKILDYDAVTIKSISTHIYEVTEDAQTEISNISKCIEYQCKPPLNLNLTTKLFNILSKYNINPNDKLQNYALSRQYKPLISSTQNMQDLRIIPYRYNSPNHVPINPLLAVFLSNYGVYLPNLYGIKGNYNNNIYGYLASNNIHNNKPFGSYKIYSDTDSSN